VQSVNDLQTKAADTETSFLKGDITDVHQVMISVEEASVAFELLMEIRNKLLDSYQQIIRMSV
jgi:flagellar hook-basal body complex protein FliE